MRSAVAVYCILVGALIAGWWAVELRGGAWSRGDRAHAELALHVVAELATAAALVAAGALLLAAAPAAVPVAAVALGMLLYTTVVSPGYFIARREIPVAAMFGGLVALTLVAMAVLVAGI